MDDLPQLPEQPKQTLPPKPKKDRRMLKGIGIGILIVVLILVVGYLGLQEYNKIYQSGINYGQEYTLSTILTETAKCQPFPIIYQNQTFNLVLYECIQQGVQNGG